MSGPIHQYRIEVEIEGPVMSAGTATPALGIDTPFQRGAGGRPTIPGSLVKGVVRHILHDHVEAGATCWTSGTLTDWFGDETGPDRSGDMAPKRAKCFFGDLTLNSEGRTETITRIAVAADTGSVVDGAMQVLEAPLGYDERGRFQGYLRISSAVSAADRSRLCGAIENALLFAGQIGSAKTSGFGRIRSVSLEEPDTDLINQLAAAPSKEALAASGVAVIELNVRDPFLLADQAISGNFFEGRPDIPGGAIKGAIANKLGGDVMDDERSKVLARTVIQHAQPIAPGSEHTGFSVPLSLCTIEDEEKPATTDEDALEVVDLLSVSRADAQLYSAISVMQHVDDWKALPASVRQYFGLAAEPPRLSGRTRTAVTPSGLAETERLFAGIGRDVSRHVWRSKMICTSDDPGERQAFADLCMAVHGVLDGIGKTKARAVCNVSSGATEPAEATASDGEFTMWRITLQSDALMHGPEIFTSGRSLQKFATSYLGYWQGVLADWASRRGISVDTQAMTLSYMASQRLVGGYISLRYPVLADRYCPYLLTSRGSTFLVGAPSACDGFFHTLPAANLPLANNWPKDRRDWQTCPYVPENGYGCVVIGRKAGFPEGGAHQ